MSKVTKFVFGAIAGGAIGAATAILLAPGSGEDTREAVRERMDRLVGEFKGAMRERRAELEEELNELSDLE